MKVMIEIDTALFAADKQNPSKAAQEVAKTLDRLITARLSSRGVVGGDIAPLFDSSGTHVGSYTTQGED